MAGFQAQVDYFGIASASLVVINSSTTPIPVSIEYARDQEGNIAGQGDYEGGPAVAVESRYRLLNSTLDLSTLSVGYLLNDATHMVVTSVAVDTSNSDWPTVKLTGFTGVSDYSTMPVFSLPAITINGQKVAQGFDFTVDAACRLTSSSLTATAEMAHVLDDSGDVGAMACTGATIAISGEAVEISDVVAWTPGGTWTETQAPGATGGNISWGTSGFAAEKYLSEDT